MKIRTCAALLIAMLALSLLAGCASSAVKALDAAEDAVEARLDAAEDAVEEVVVQAALPEPTQPAPAQTVAPAPVTPEPAPVETTPPAPVETAPPAIAAEPVPAAPKTPTRLTPEEVQAIALEHAGLTAGQVKHLRAEFDFDDGVPEYDVEFREGRWEYEYEIHAETGAIRSYDKDWDD